MSIYCECHFCCSDLQVAGVIWFVFHVLELLRIRFTQQTHVALAIYDEIFAKKMVEIWTSLDLIMVSGSARLLVS